MKESKLLIQHFECDYLCRVMFQGMIIELSEVFKWRYAYCNDSLDVDIKFNELLN